MIASYLVPNVHDWQYESSEKYKALQSLALTSKAWKATAYQYLHYRVKVEPERLYYASSVAHSAEKVLSRLVSRPETASMVKELSVYYYYEPGSKNEKYDTEHLLKVVDGLEVTKDLKSDMKRCVQKRSRPLPEPFPLHTILPAICKRLRVYEINLCKGVDQETLKAMMSDAARNGSTVFQHLREMDITGERYSMDLDLLTTILRIPALQTLSTDIFDVGLNFHFISDDQPTDSVHSSLRKINLSKGIIDSNMLAFLLKACPLMQEISVVSEAMTKAYRLQKFEYESLGNILRQYGTGLTSLKLEYRKPKACEIHLAENSADYSYSQTLGSLATLTKLRTLSVQVRSLFGRDWKDIQLVQCLPTSLERLELADFDENVLRGRTRVMDIDVMDTGLLPNVGPEAFGAKESWDLRRHIDSEIASVFEDERFERLSKIIIVCTENSRKLWPDAMRYVQRIGQPRIVYSKGGYKGRRKVTR